MNFETIFPWFLVLFSMIFSLIFRFAQKPLPETIFGGSKRQSMHKSVIFEPFWDFGGVRNPPLGRHFRPKNLKMSSTPYESDPPGADLGAIWRRKRSKDYFPWFETAFGRFWKDFRGNLKDFEGPPTYFYHFSKTQTINPTHLQTTFLEPWNDKTAKRRTTKRTPPNDKSFLRPGGMRASAFNPPPPALAGEQCVLNSSCSSCQTAQFQIPNTFCPIPNFTNFTSISVP